MNLDQFCDTEVNQNNGIVTTKVKWKNRTSPLHWISTIPKRYIRNSVMSDLNKTLCISSPLADEISKIRQKFLNGDDSLRFINSAIKKLNEKSRWCFDDILPPKIKKQVILIKWTRLLKQTRKWLFYTMHTVGKDCKKLPRYAFLIFQPLAYMLKYSVSETWSEMVWLVKQAKCCTRKMVKRNTSSF